MKPLAFLLLPLLSLAACTQTMPFPTYTVPQAPSTAAIVVHGNIQSFNLDATGRAEGLMLKSADQVRQVNFPQALVSTIATSVSPGETVDAVIAPILKNDGSDHPIFRLVCLRDSKGRMYAAPNRVNDRSVQVQGTIRQISTDDAGQVTGITLNTGDFVNVTPGRLGTHDLQQGMQFAASGYAVASPTGGLFVQAEEINGLALRVVLPPGAFGGGQFEEEGGDMEGYGMEGGE
jgi:hypothetical protein